jgi:hypothetical protein
MFHDESSSIVQLRFVRGSHKWGWFHPRKFATEQNYAVISSTEGQPGRNDHLPANNQLFCGRFKFNCTKDELASNFLRENSAYNFQAINIINFYIDHGFSKSMFL